MNITFVIVQDPSVCFVISSDFCHWGDRFHYTHYDSAAGEIHQSIKVGVLDLGDPGDNYYVCLPQALDHAGMDIIERLDAPGFTSYLKQYGNTICGRHPIGVFLNMVAELRAAAANGYNMDLKFLKYAQSSQVRVRDSHASARIIFHVQYCFQTNININSRGTFRSRVHETPPSVMHPLLSS